MDIVSKGGAYLLNVGPTAEGILPQPSVERLLAMGKWLQVNGEAIYGTRPGPIQGVDWLRTTSKPGRLYLHIFEWPTGGMLAIPGIEGRQAYLLGDPQQRPLPLGVHDGVLTIQGPAAAPDAQDTVVVVILVGEDGVWLQHNRRCARERGSSLIQAAICRLEGDQAFLAALFVSGAAGRLAAGLQLLSHVRRPDRVS